jgi:surface antigen
MAQRLLCLSVLAATGLGAACINTTDVPVDDNVSLTSAALTICEEAVPANRNVDGIPSYAQCPESENSAIYSNNGVDTSTTQMGSDWVRTQWSGGYQCTELANRYLKFRWGVKWIPNGNAGEWCNTQPPANSGMVQTMTPVHGDIMVLAPGSCGAAQGTGHVTVVDEVNESKLVVVEQNGARRGNYMLSCAKCFLHVMANDGVAKPADGTSPGGASTAGAAAPAMPTTPATAPMQGAAGSGDAMSGWSGRGRRPAAAAGAAAPSSVPMMTAPPAPAATAPTAPPTAAPVASASMPVVGAAGSAAVTPLASAVTTPASTSAAAEGGCSVAGVGATQNAGLPVTLGLGLLVALRARRRGKRVR